MQNKYAQNTESMPSKEVWHVQLLTAVQDCAFQGTKVTAPPILPELPIIVLTCEHAHCIIAKLVADQPICFCTILWRDHVQRAVFQLQLRLANALALRQVPPEFLSLNVLVCIELETCANTKPMTTSITIEAQPSESSNKNIIEIGAP